MNKNCDHSAHRLVSEDVPASSSTVITFRDGSQAVRHLCDCHVAELRKLWDDMQREAFGHIADVGESLPL